MSPRRPVADRKPEAFTTEDARRLLQPLTRFRHVGIAVSGGSDSVGLMLLAARAGLATRSTVLTVDHGLRAQSGEEAARVAVWARDLGFRAAILRWEDPKPRTGVQEHARAARYRLMAEWCARHGSEAVATAHTLDDQAETLLMRLARGSGVDGLSAMPAMTMRHGIRILRPLLGIERRRLARFVARESHAFISDPSNENPAFERVRIRKAGAALGELGLRPPALALAARRLQRARAALESATDQLQAKTVTVAPEMYATVDAAAFSQAPEELRIRLLSRLLAAMGGTSETPDLAQVERAAQWLGEDEGRARTLGGCRIHRRSTVFLVGREGGRMGDDHDAHRHRRDGALRRAVPRPCEAGAGRRAHGRAARQGKGQGNRAAAGAAGLRLRNAAGPLSRRGSRGGPAVRLWAGGAGSRSFGRSHAIHRLSVRISLRFSQLGNGPPATYVTLTKAGVGFSTTSP